MKKYTKPQIEVNLLEINDIITISIGIFSGLADLDSSESTTFDESILDPKDTF